MPTAFDDFTKKAHLDYEDLPEEVLSNRKLLIAVMVAEGFTPLATEWWHYNDSAAEACPLLSTTFQARCLRPFLTWSERLVRFDSPSSRDTSLPFFMSKNAGIKLIS